MLWKTHLAFGLLSALVMKSFVNTGNIWIFYSLVLLGALLPDIDKSNSKVGKKSGIISKFIQALFGHRGLFHTIYIPLILFFVISYFFAKPYAVALIIGYISHLLIDGFTKAGINFLHPLLELRLQGFVETGSIIETVLFIGIIAVDVIRILVEFGIRV